MKTERQLVYQEREVQDKHSVTRVARIPLLLKLKGKINNNFITLYIHAHV